MSQRTTKRTIVVLSIFIGVVIGLVLASNFNLAQNGFADSESENEFTHQSQTVPQVSSDLESASRAFVAIAKRVTPAVVSITSEKVVKVKEPLSNFFHNDDFFRRFFRQPNGDQEYKQRGLGSGVIVSFDGYILTNYHVIKDADEISVMLDKKPYDAKIIGTDPATDIAVIKIDAKDLPAVVLGNSEKLEVGEWVLAIGSPFDLRLQHTVTSGIISGMGRTLNLSGELTYQDFIQTDAAINPGNSGGALVNIKGELIGINTAIYAGNSGGNIGIGFAVPIGLAKKVMDDLIAHGEVVRGYLGVYITTPDDELSEALKIDDNKGAVVTEVVAGTPADKAGLKKYDVIVSVEGKKIDGSQELTNLIASYLPGQSVHLSVIRDGSTRDIVVVLEKRGSPDSPAPQISRKDEMTEKIGLELSDVTSELADRFELDDTEGVLVTDVRSNSVAEEKGLRTGDLIVEVDRKEVKSVREVRGIVERFEPGQIALFQVRRGRGNHFIALKVPK